MKQKIKDLLLWSQQYTQVDMLYIAKGGFWSGLSFFINSVLSLVLLVAFANLLPKESYGIYKYVISLANSISFLTLTGMNIAVSQAIARGHEEIFPYAVKTQLKWNVLFLLGASALGTYYLLKGNAVFAFSLFILGAFFPLNTALNTYGIFLHGKREFKKNSLYGMTAGIFYFLMMLGILFLTDNVLALVAVYAAASFLPTLFFYLRTVKTVKSDGSVPKERKEVLRYAKHLSVTNVFSVISQYIDKILVFQFLGPVSLAVYAIASAVPERVSGFIKNISTLILPKISDKDISEIKAVFYKRVIQSVIIGSALSAIYILTAPILFKIFIPQYLDSLFYSQLLSLSFIFLAPANYVGNVFHAKKMIGTIYRSSVAANVLRIALFLTLGIYWGILGMITSTLLMYLAGTFYNLFLWRKELNK